MADRMHGKEKASDDSLVFGRPVEYWLLLGVAVTAAVAVTMSAIIMGAAPPRHYSEYVRGLAAEFDVPPAQVQLWFAATDGNVELLIDLLDNEKDVSIHSRDPSGMLPSMLAVVHGRANVLRVLINRYDANSCEHLDDGRSLLIMAASHGHAEVVSVLVENGAGTHVGDRNQRTPLHAAAEIDNIEVMKALFENRPPIDAKNSDGETPLFVAAMGEADHAVRYLLDEGAKCIPRTDGTTPIHVAAMGREPTALQFLLEAGCADTPAEDGSTALHFAAEAGSVPCTKLLLVKAIEHPDDPVMVPRHDGALPVVVAAREGHTEVVKAFIDVLGREAAEAVLPEVVGSGDLALLELLLSTGVDVNAANTRDGLPPLCAAVRTRDEVAVTVLLREGADANQRTTMGWSPLHIAAELGAFDIARDLLAAGAAISAEGPGGWQPAAVAADHDNAEIIELFCDELGALDAPVGPRRMTAIHIAASRGNVDVMRTIIKCKGNLRAVDGDGRTRLTTRRKLAASPQSNSLSPLALRLTTKARPA